jgi:hypothetical protein
VTNTKLWNNEISQKKYSFGRREMETLTPMEEFQKTLLSLYESEKQSKELSPDDILLYDNVINFIPSNEIGLGCSLLNANCYNPFFKGLKRQYIFFLYTSELRLKDFK